MARRTFIKVRRGILEAKHVHALGVRYPIYLWLLDRANWETGKVLFYRDRDIADEFEMPIRTIREWRRKLEEDGYISCLQISNHQEITIKKWSNPRGDEEINPIYEYQGCDTNMEHPPSWGSKNMEHQDDKTPGGYMPGYMPGSRKHVTLPISDITHHTTDSVGSEKNEMKYRSMFDYFVNECKFKEPKIPSGKFDISWDGPIKEILNTFDWNIERALRYTKMAVQRADKNHLTITTPKSLINIFHAITGENSRKRSANVGKEFHAEDIL